MKKLTLTSLLVFLIASTAFSQVVTPETSTYVNGNPLNLKADTDNIYIAGVPLSNIISNSTPSGCVASLNGLQGDVDIVAGNNISLETNDTDKTLTISVSSNMLNSIPIEFTGYNEEPHFETNISKLIFDSETGFRHYTNDNEELVISLGSAWTTIYDDEGNSQHPVGEEPLRITTHDNNDKIEWMGSTNINGKDVKILSIGIGYIKHPVEYVQDNDENYTAITIGNRIGDVGKSSVAIGDFVEASGDYSFTYNGDISIENYSSHGEGTFNINPEPIENSDDPLTGFYIGETNLYDYFQEIKSEIPTEANVSNTVYAILNSMLTDGWVTNGMRYKLVVQSFELPPPGYSIFYFNNESSITNFDLTKMDQTYRNNSSLTKVEFGTNITSIGKWAFGNCSALTNIVLRSSITNIENMAFYQCENLNDILLPSNIKELVSHTFAFCRNLSNITFSEGLTTIGWNAFFGCTGLINISFPNSLTRIESGAFTRCSNLSYIEIQSNINYIAYDSFSECTNLLNITINGKNSSTISNMLSTHYWGLPSGCVIHCEDDDITVP